MSLFDENNRVALTEDGGLDDTILGRHGGSGKWDLFDKVFRNVVMMLVREQRQRMSVKDSIPDQVIA